MVETTIGKKVIRNVITTRGVSPAPRTTIIIGATATTGVDWITTSSGYKVRESNSERASITATGIETAIAKKYPINATLSVAQTCSPQRDTVTS